MMDRELGGTWEWLWTIMECTESQLRFGTSLAAASDPSGPGHPTHEGQGKAGMSKDKRGNDDGIALDKKARSVLRKLNYLSLIKFCETHLPVKLNIFKNINILL